MSTSKFLKAQNESSLDEVVEEYDSQILVAEDRLINVEPIIEFLRKMGSTDRS